MNPSSQTHAPSSSSSRSPSPQSESGQESNLERDRSSQDHQGDSEHSLDHEADGAASGLVNGHATESEAEDESDSELDEAIDRLYALVPPRPITQGAAGLTNGVASEGEEEHDSENNSDSDSSTDTSDSEDDDDLPGDNSGDSDDDEPGGPPNGDNSGNSSNPPPSQDNTGDSRNGANMPDNRGNSNGRRVRFSDMVQEYPDRSEEGRDGPSSGDSINTSDMAGTVDTVMMDADTMVETASIQTTALSLHMKDIPEIRKGVKFQDIEKVVKLYKEYKYGCGEWNQDSEPLDVLLRRGKEFALALLSHYFPENQGFVISEKKSFVPMDTYGWTIELKVPKGEESKYPFGSWHRIQKENIGGYEVGKRYIAENEDGTESEIIRPHTFFAIMADDGKTQPRWMPSKKDRMFRGDIMSYALGSQAGINQGYCFLLVGAFFEFYAFNSDDEHQPIKRHPHAWFPQNWSQDLFSVIYKQEVPWIIDLWLREVVPKDVLYEDGTVGDGVHVIPHWGSDVSEAESSGTRS